MTTATARDLNRRIGFDCVCFDGPIPVQEGVYRLSDDPNIALQGDAPDYVGCDSIALAHLPRHAPAEAGIAVRRAAGVLCVDGQRLEE